MKVGVVDCGKITTFYIQDSSFSQHSVVSKENSLCVESSKAKQKRNWPPKIVLAAGLNKLSSWHHKAKVNV